MLTAAQVKHLSYADTCSRKGDVYTVRREFFYTHGRSSHDFAEALKADIQADGKWVVTVLDHGEVWKPFRGGATTANSSHWWVKFTLRGA